MSAPFASASVLDEGGFTSALAAALESMPSRVEHTAAVRHRIFERVRQSALAHRSFVTVRREDRPWSLAAPGVQQQSISQAAGLRVDVLHLAPDAPLPWLPGSQAHEVLVVEGSLQALSPGAPAQTWPTLHQAVRGRLTAAGQVVRAGGSGARVYLRSLMVDQAQLPAREAAWWTAGLALQPVTADLRLEWAPFLEGVDAALLHGVDDVVSMLIRLAPGATLPNHGHSLDEDCFMLEGHMFLGDILMRAGDYQRAPVGCKHAGICSDTGGLFYFHGALPPAASDVEP